ncbi:MAG: InlB B-repeat-containing protein, partial [Fibrobacter sp.]|nr:InlB B-repeat-containing protein [Fibrobacter sp.]
MKIWAFSNKFVLIAGLFLASQGFAANCAADYVPPENPVWNGSTKTEPCTKDGFYIIDNAAKLAWYAKNYDKGNAKLTADIDLGGKLWTPIAAGQGNAKYSKTFDGNGHVIKNMYINGTELAQIDKNYAQNLGFIGTLGNVKADQPGGTVKNIIFENVDIQASTNAGDILGRDDSQISVGVVVGWMAENNQNVVENCVAASGTIRTTGKGQGVGGIVGNAKNGTISNCLSLVEIHTSGADAYIGGIIGITKTNVTVSSCVYAGPGLVNTGTNGLTGGVVGNVYTGTITTENNYFEGGGSAGVGGSICTKNCNKPPLDSASFNNANTNAQKVNETNVDNVACALNGTNDDGSCKEEPWSVGQTGLSLNGYGADGYKIIFSANGGAFADSAVTKNIYLASGMAITDNEVGKPSRDGFSFEGWAASADAEVSLVDLGTVSKSAKFYAVWAPLNTITFNVAPGSFSLGEQSKTKQVANGEVITVEGLGALPESYCSKYDTVHVGECATTSYFTGWALDSAAAVADTLSLDTVTASDGLTLYAVWDTVETYTVTYNANLHGMTTVDYVRVGAGDTVAAPTDPIADTGYVFDGWFTDAEGVNQYQFAAQIHESIILYAKWVLDTFTVAYEMNGVSNAGENPVFYTIETPTFVLAAPADSEGYVFEGWFYDANFTNPASQLIQGTTGDKTFY